MVDAPASKRGFTLIELIVTLSIAAILLTVAVPNFIAFIQNNRLTAQANDLVTAFNYARSEAIKRGVQVTVCSRDTDTTCAASTTWDTGWLVFVDADGNGAVASAADVLQVRQPLENSNTLRVDNRQRVTYRNSGYPGSDGFDDTFRLCDTRGLERGRSIAVNLQGRVTIQRDAETNQPSPPASCP